MGSRQGAGESCRGRPGYVRHERKRRLEEIEQSKSRKLVEHEQQPMPASLGLEVLGETAAADLVEDQSHQRLGAADVRWRYDVRSRMRQSQRRVTWATPGRNLDRHCVESAPDRSFSSLSKQLPRRGSDHRMCFPNENKASSTGSADSYDQCATS
jgi:hypothetical protein